MRISHSSEDKHLGKLLGASFKAIKSQCGTFTLEDSERGRELVFERSRYAYNDYLEFFEDNFLSMINGFAFENLPEVEEDA